LSELDQLDSHPRERTKLQTTTEKMRRRRLCENDEEARRLSLSQTVDGWL